MSGGFPFLVLFSLIKMYSFFIAVSNCHKLRLESTPIYDHAGLWVKVQDVPG